MRFEARHRFQATLAEVEQGLLDERYTEFLLKHHGVLLEAKVIDKQDDGTKVRRKIRYRPKPVIEAIGPKKVPPELFAFVEESTYDRTKHELTFKNTPTSNTISSMLHNVGTLKLREVNGQCERITDGEISLKLPFFLRPLAMIGEPIIQREGLKILDGEVQVMNKFVAEVIRGGTKSAP